MEAEEELAAFIREGEAVVNSVLMVDREQPPPNAPPAQVVDIMVNSPPPSCCRDERSNRVRTKLLEYPPPPPPPAKKVMFEHPPPPENHYRERSHQTATESLGGGGGEATAMFQYPPPPLPYGYGYDDAYDYDERPYPNATQVPKEVSAPMMMYGYSHHQQPNTTVEEQPQETASTMYASDGIAAHPPAEGATAVVMPESPTVDARKRRVAWTTYEHREFLVGLKICGKGQWTSISKKFVPSKSPEQVASHAQKFYKRLQYCRDGKRQRRSIHDVTAADEEYVRRRLHGVPPQHASLNSDGTML